MFVRFKLSAGLHFSRELGGPARALIEETVREANEHVFRKGVPAGVSGEEAGRIVHWDIDGNVLRLDIESGPYTRAHDALFRFRKLVAQRLGKAERTGLRKIEVLSFRIIIPGRVPEGAIPKIGFIRDARICVDRLELDLDVTAADLENRVPDRIVTLTREKAEAAAFGGKSEHWQLVHESGPKERLYDQNPTGEMIRRNWIRHGASRGQWIFGPQAVRLVRALEEIVMEEIIRPLGFHEMIFPKLVPWEVWKRSGHAKGVYPEIYYVCTPKSRDPAYWESVADTYRITGEVPVEAIRERLDGPIGGLCYAQCPPFWPFVQGETLANDCLPIRVFDRSGTSHRYESGGIHGIERVDEFHRIEVLWLGTREQTIEVADRLHEAYSRVFEEILDLEWRCAQVTPWFMAQEGLVGESGQENVGTRDYEAILPYNGSWLEFQNVSINGDKYPRSFNVKIQSGEDCWSGCSGIGLERWLAVFLAQKGFDTDRWPDRVRDLFGDVVEVFRFM
ncbi:MAG: serine--tRNA ligase [Methanoculleaceae archaeon]